MPKQYEAIRDKFASKGMDYDEAQTRAAKIYNAAHPGAPVTGSSEGAQRGGTGATSSAKKRPSRARKKKKSSNFDYLQRNRD